MKNSIEILLLRIKTQSTRKSRASDAKHLLEGDLEIIEKLATEALDNLTSSSRIISSAYTKDDMKKAFDAAKTLYNYKGEWIDNDLDIDDYTSAKYKDFNNWHDEHY